MTISVAVLLLVFFLISSVFAQNAGHGEQDKGGGVYLKCTSRGDLDGVNDLYIDLKTKTFTDHFGTVTSYREEGQFLLAETFIEVDSKKMLASSRRLNKFTLEFSWLSPTLNLHKSGRCMKVEARL
jgi:hypothetical protein